MPPVVSCEQGSTPDVTPIPAADIETWVEQGPPWARAVLGILTEERRLRAEEHRCLREHREAGHIR